jgi:hypothetical protein
MISYRRTDDLQTWRLDFGEKIAGIIAKAAAERSESDRLTVKLLA